MFNRRASAMDGRDSGTLRGGRRPRAAFRARSLEQLEGRSLLSVASTLAVSAASGTYRGTTNLVATLTGGGGPLAGQPVEFFLNGTDIGPGTTNAGGVASINGASLGTINALTYTGGVTATFAGDANFNPSNGAGDLVVNPAPVTVVINNQSKVYGVANPTLTGTITGVLGQDVVGANYTTTATQFSDVLPGGYPITLAGLSGAQAANYSTTVAGGSVTNGALTVTQAPVQITVENQAKVYGQANPTLAGTIAGLLNGDAVGANYSTTATQFSDVTPGGYAITVLGLAGPKSRDYSTTVAGGSVTNGVLAITPAPLTVAIASTAKVYGQDNPSFTGGVSGILNGDNVVANYTTVATKFSDVTPAGYPITLAGLGGAKAGDYSTTVAGGSVTNGALTVAQAPVQITVDSKAKVYGQVNPTLTGTITGLLNGDAVGANYSTTATQFSDVTPGGYPITVQGLSGPKAGNYTATSTPGKLTVTPVPLTIAVNNQSKVYGIANPPLTGTVTGTLNGDVVGANYTTTATQFSDVVAGGYPITLAGLTGAKAADYSATAPGGSVTDGRLTITPVTLSATIDSKLKVYGQANPTLTGTLNGVYKGDDVSAIYATTATPSSDVNQGGYPISVAGLAGAKAIDYVVGSSTPGFLGVTPAPLSITVNNATKVYGQANPAFNVSYNGFVLGQGPGALPGALGFSTPANDASHVGTYLVTPSGLTSTNYAINYVTGNLAVTPAPLVITPVNVINAYGRPIPALTPSYSGFVNGDTPASLTTQATLATTATIASHVGVYPITATGAAATDYTITYVDGAIAIIPAPLVIAPVNVIKTYGVATPALTANYYGFVNGDTPASLATPLVLSSYVTKTTTSGVFPISASGATSRDYEISYFPAAIAVTVNQGQAAFITSLYQSILNRLPEDFGFYGWIGELAGGKSEFDVAHGIYNSIEANKLRAGRNGQGISFDAAYTLALKTQADASKVATMA